ncbi:hypothetical protein QR680_013747 [Steinernema hermaphroditum]|uniref:Fatty-acid and retinol-binding protein 1 n=1 Tax=Steinernema hermaphroditum TaxID=289476 RepID=A0AA39I947_9BILA|nr:hypothetical protein QR680_013747 [Steinernema hermaphroditum]
MFSSSRSLILLALCGLAVYSLPVPTDGDIKSIYDILPENIKKFYQNLTPEDVKVFESFGNSTLSAQEIYEQIKVKSPQLFQRMNAMAKSIAAKIDTLSDESKSYLNSLIEQFKSMRNVDGDKFADQLVGKLSKAKSLSAKARGEILKAFPTLTPIFDDGNSMTS